MPSAFCFFATSSGKSLYSIIRVRPSICTTFPTRSSGSRLATASVLISDLARMWYPKNAGSQTSASGLSTWK